MRVLLALVAGGALGAGCSCTEAGCIGLVEVGLDVAALEGDVGAGYLFRVSVDGATGSCSGVVGGSFACTDGWQVDYTGQSDTAPPIDDSVPAALWLDGEGELEQVQVVVIREGETLLDETFAADGEVFAPNGRRCGPICEGLTIDLDW